MLLPRQSFQRNILQATLPFVFRLRRDSEPVCSQPEALALSRSIATQQSGPKCVIFDRSLYFPGAQASREDSRYASL